MTQEPKGESSKHVINRSNHNRNLGEATVNATGLILSLVKEAATIAPCQELKIAAGVALIIFDTIQAVKDNKASYRRLGDDSTRLIVAIWSSCKKAESQTKWLSAEMQEILIELTQILNDICSFVQEQLARSKTIRVIYSRADVKKIVEYRENLNAAMQKFELQSHMNIDMKLDKLSEEIRSRNDEDIKRALEITARDARDREDAERVHQEELTSITRISALERLKQVEIDHQAEDKRGNSEELKKIEKDIRDRKSELERLRATVRANRLAQAEEEEMIELRRKIAAGRQSTTHQRQSNKNKKSFSQRDQVEDEEEWESKEEERIGRPVKIGSKIKMNSYNSPRRPHVALENSSDDEEEHSQPPEMKRTRRKLSRTYVEEPEDQLSAEEESPPPKRGPKVNRKPQSPPREVDDLTAQFQEFGTPSRNSPHGSRSDLPMPVYPSPYGSPFPPSMPPYGYYGYGYGGGGPGTVVNTGVGNITNTTISNVGNDNSVKKVYRAPRPRNTGT